MAAAAALPATAPAAPATAAVAAVLEPEEPPLVTLISMPPDFFPAVVLSVLSADGEVDDLLDELEDLLLLAANVVPAAAIVPAIARTAARVVMCFMVQSSSATSTSFGASTRRISCG